jgi:hypothetical protein
MYAMACGSAKGPTDFEVRDYRGTRWLDLSGKQVGLLTVLRHVGFKGKMSIWLCRCVCGTECYRRGPFLAFLLKHPEREGYAVQMHCGCASRDRSSCRDKTALHLWERIRGQADSGWQEFDSFYQFWQARTDKFLVRHDQTQPFSPANCIWSEHTEAWHRTAKLVVAYLVKNGESESDAWRRVNSVSRERLRQLANKSLGQCPHCSAPVSIGYGRCDACRRINSITKRRAHERQRTPIAT